MSNQCLGMEVNSFQYRLHRQIASRLDDEFKQTAPSLDDAPGPLALRFLSQKIQGLVPQLSKADNRRSLDADLLHELSFYLDRLDAHLGVLATAADRQVLSGLLPLLESSLEARIRAKAFLAAYTWLSRQVLADHRDSIYLQTLRRSARRALEQANEDVWCTVGAACILILVEESETAQVLIRAALQFREKRDDVMFFKAHLIEKAKSDQKIDAALAPFFALWTQDPSPYVKIRLSEVLLQHDPVDELRRTHLTALLRDADPKVVCAAALEWIDLYLTRGGNDRDSLQRVLNFLLEKNDPYVLTIVSLHIEQRLRRSALEGSDSEAAACLPLLTEFFQTLRAAYRDDLRRKATLNLRWIEVLGDERQLHMLRKLAPFLATSETDLLLPHTEGFYEEEAMNCLVLLASSDLGLELSRTRQGWRVRRGYHFAFSAWRLVYEWKNRSSIKRQGHAHWVSRSLKGSVKIPSQRVCELVETTVPGEPLYIEEADGWRPWLPLACDFYRLLRFFRVSKLDIWTPEGRTSIESPRRLHQRVKAWWYLTRHYSLLAKLRNFQSRVNFAAESYIEAFRALGYRITFETGGRLLEGADTSVTRHFEVKAP